MAETEECDPEKEELEVTSPSLGQAKRRPRRPKYAWVILIVSFLTQFANPSINYTVGVYHVAFLERFNADVTLVAWVGAFYSCMFAFAGPVASLVTNVFDCRTCVFLSGILGAVGFGASAFVTNIRLLFLTYAFIAGLGQAFAQVASVVILGYYFPLDISMATGVVISGTALGTFVHPPLVQRLLDTFGLPGAFLLTGAVVLHCCIFGLLMRPSAKELDRKRKIKSGRTPNEAILFAIFGGSIKNRKIFLDLSFWAMMLSTLLFSMAYNVHIVFLPDYMTRIHHAASQEASLMISFIGVGSFIARLSLGALGNDDRVGPEVIYFSILGITAFISLFISLFSGGTGGRLLYGLLFGLYTGGVFPLQSCIALKITGVDNFALAYGSIMFSLGVGFLIGPPVAGSIYKSSSNYTHVFISSSVMFFAATIFGILLGLRFREQKKEKVNVLLELKQ